MFEEHRARLRKIILREVEVLFLVALENAKSRYPSKEIICFKNTLKNIESAKIFCETRDSYVVDQKHYLMVACDDFSALEAPFAIDIPITSSN